jgi:SPP1 family phage portal protein
LGVFNRFKQPDLPKAPSNSNSDLRYLEKVLRKWLESPIRKEQLTAEKYYDGDQAILYREKKVIGADGNLVTIDNVANNRLVDNQYRKLVDQKTNYCLGKPLIISTANEDYAKLLGKVFNKNMNRKLRVLAQFAVDGGISWLYPYYDEESNFCVEIFPSYEICPVWKDKMHTRLESAMRYYSEEVFDDKGGVQLIYHVDLFTTGGITHFRYQGGNLIPEDNPHSDYMYVGEKGYNWTKLPIIPFKYNTKEIPLIRAVKSLQDALNEVLSDFQNNMQEDPRTTILVLKNYDGTNIPEFRQNLATYGVIKVTTVDGVQGGVEALKVEVNAQNYQAILMQLKRAIVENGRGFDAKEERMDGDPNQMNIESMYTDIDLDVDTLESEFQAGFEELKWFIDQYLIHTGNPDYAEEDVEFIFDRDFFINENAKIDNIMKSVGLVSDETLLEHHPMVKNKLVELERKEAQKQAELDEMNATLKVQAKNTPTPTNGGDE